jgi:hypothetical protein
MQATPEWSTWSAIAKASVITVGERQAYAQHQAPAGGRSGLKEPAPGEIVR